MKLVKKLTVIAISSLLMFSIAGMNVFAASTTQDGLEVSLTTDKETYLKDEKITATLSVTNTNDEDITNLSPDRRGIGIVFQNYALFENMTALDNAAYALRFHGKSRGEAESMARETLSRVGLSGEMGKYPSELSGGQQQRVAIARTLVLHPDVILFDEPMAALDAETRLVLQDEILRIRNEFAVTMIYVTHDQEEAFAMSDRILVLDLGKKRQIGTPVELLKTPADDYVRRFVGDNLARRRKNLERFL